MGNKQIKSQQIFLPTKRKETIEDNISNKLRFLQSKKHIESLYIMPDLSDDGFILSGLAMETKDVFHPFSMGTDLGCGYRILHTSFKKRELKLIEDRLNNVAVDFILPEESTISKHLFSLFLSRNYNELILYFQQKQIISSKIEFYNNDNFHYLSPSSFFDAWGNIAIGNHFIELREVSTIFDSRIANALDLNIGDVITHIHSGAGKKIENEFTLYLAKFLKLYKQTNQLKSNKNGYEVIIPLNEVLAQEFISDSLDSILFSMFNRSYMAYKLQKWFGNNLIDWYDVPHDSITLKNNKITSQKGIQSYETVKGHDIAIIPGSLNTSSYIVRRKNSVSFINHGTGEGNEGKLPVFSNVITNLKKPIKRKYHDIEETIKYLQEAELIELVAELKPWISIKRER